MNSVVLIGRLTRDPEIRYTASSQMAVASFTIAIDRPVRAGGEKQTDFPRITVFGRQAENCERYLAKGRTAPHRDRTLLQITADSKVGIVSKTMHRNRTMAARAAIVNRSRAVCRRRCRILSRQLMKTFHSKERRYM